MPTIPTVFRSLRTNDVQHRPFKVYKNYTINQSSYADRSVRLQRASHFHIPPTIGDTTTAYVTNNLFNSTNNMHVMWNSLDHKYYRYPYDPAKSLEITNPMFASKFLFCSASILTMPYFDVGERIKASSINIESTVQNFQGLNDYTINLYDDSYGNLKDTQINSASFANKNQLQFYMSFNNTYRKFAQNFGNMVSGSVAYKIGSMDEAAIVRNIEMLPGVSTHASASIYIPSGISAKFDNTKLSYIRVNDHPNLKTFNNCDQWTLSFWIKPAAVTTRGTILSKGGRKIQEYYDRKDDLIKKREVNVRRPAPNASNNRLPGDFSKFKTPFHVTLGAKKLHFLSSDGSHQLHISASVDTNNYRDGWAHVLIQNSSSICSIYINGTESGTSGSLPKLNTDNNAFMFIGSDGNTETYNEYLNTSMGGFNGNIAELRMYDYTLSAASKISLANQNFYSGSLYQSSVAGNSFYRNGQLVITSPLKKYDNIFISSSNIEPGTFNVSYRGTHTIYENEVMVRVPKGAANVSMNPSSTYRPSTGLDNNCTTGESKNGPGEFRKTMFTSGSAFPYITTIGLYDDKARLLAVGKMAEPIQKRNDVDMNFVLRWDY